MYVPEYRYRADPLAKKVVIVHEWLGRLSQWKNPNILQLQKLKLAEEEAQEYQAYLQKLEDETEDESRVWELERELAGLQMEEEKLQLNLKSLKEDQTKAEADLEVLLVLVLQLTPTNMTSWRIIPFEMLI